MVDPPQFVEQAGYLEHIYPDATSTIRVLTLRTDEGIRIAAAAHRFGSARAGALDNFSKGGLSAAVDRETGALSAAATPTGCGPVWHDHHPDTGAAIAGVSVPGWQEIRDQLRTIAAETTTFDHVGWDIVVTGPGSSGLSRATAIQTLTCSRCTNRCSPGRPFGSSTSSAGCSERACAFDSSGTSTR